jgi:hypothetical protein
VELVAIFIVRHGFSTGGGPHVVSRETLIDRLANPEKLVAAIAREPALLGLRRRISANRF